MKACRNCLGPFDPKEWQIAKGDFACPSCRRTQQAEWRARRKAEGNPVVSPRLPREYHRAYQAAYTQKPAVRARRNEQMRRYAKAPETAPHHSARRQVRSAVEAGLLSRLPCEVCGETKVHAHHDDYSKPLDVRWLCQMHHSEHHAKATGDAP